MLPYTVSHILDAFAKAKNLNASMKNFLKREVKRGDPAEKFTKDLRDVLLSDDVNRSEQFFAKHLPKYESHLFVAAGYAHYDLVNGLAASIVERYADDFNATYEVQDEKLTYKDRPNFEKLAKEAITLISAGLKPSGLDGSPFMLNVVFVSIFTREVIGAIEPLVDKLAA